MDYLPQMQAGSNVRYSASALNSISSAIFLKGWKVLAGAKLFPSFAELPSAPSSYKKEMTKMVIPYLII